MTSDAAARTADPSPAFLTKRLSEAKTKLGQRADRIEALAAALDSERAAVKVAEEKLGHRAERIEALAAALGAERAAAKATRADLKAQGRELARLTREARALRRQLEDAQRENSQYSALVRKLLPSATWLPDLPPQSLRLHVGTRTTEANFLSQGALSAERVIRDFSPQDGPILDWGCGSGRTLNWLLKDAAWREAYYGCDVDAEAIAWLQSLGARAQVCADEPPLPYPDNFFAGIFSFSVLTHIPPVHHQGWYKEFHRILRPGGRVLCTTSGEISIASNDPRIKSHLPEIAEQGWAFSEAEGHYKHIAIVSQEFTRKAYGDLFVEESYNNPPYGPMDAFILRKV